MARLEYVIDIPDPTIWDTDTATWGEANFVYAEARPVAIIGQRFFQMDHGPYFDVTPVGVSLVRTGLTLFGRDRAGQPANDPEMIKEILGMWPSIKGIPGTEILIYAGGQRLAEDAVFWEGPQKFVIGRDAFIDFTVSGRYLAVRFESIGAEPWELSGYELEIEPVGER